MEDGSRESGDIKVLIPTVMWIAKLCAMKIRQPHNRNFTLWDGQAMSTRGGVRVEGNCKRTGGDCQRAEVDGGTVVGANLGGAATVGGGRFLSQFPTKCV